MRKHLPILINMVVITILVTILIDRQRAAAAEGTLSRNTAEPTELPQNATHQIKAFQDLERAEPVTKTAYWQREPKPFEVVTQRGGYGWTNEDGTEPSVMRVLANNDRMLSALGNENTVILRRQLVYAPENFGERARDIFRQEEQEVALPGFDGELFSVEIDKVVPQDTAEVSGSFAGHIQGLEGSSVVAASERDHWSIGITLPNRQLQITTREPGEWMLVEYDPNAINDTPDCSCCPNGIHITSNAPSNNSRPFLGGSAIDTVGSPIQLTN